MQDVNKVVEDILKLEKGSLTEIPPIGVIAETGQRGLLENTVANFAYTKEAFDGNDCQGVTEFDFAKQQNIPANDAESLNTDAGVLNTGFQTNAASSSRDSQNHFWGRVSYNLNKLHTFFANFLANYQRDLAQNNNFYSNTTAYFSGDVCFTLIDGDKRTFIRTEEGSQPSIGLAPTGEASDIFWLETSRKYAITNQEDFDVLLTLSKEDIETKYKGVISFAPNNYDVTGSFNLDLLGIKACYGNGSTIAFTDYNGFGGGAIVEGFTVVSKGAGFGTTKMFFNNYKEGQQHWRMFFARGKGLQYDKLSVGSFFTQCTGEGATGNWRYPIITNTGRVLFGSGNGGIIYSDDGINFTQCTGEGATDYWQYPIITNTGRILFGNNNGNSGIIYSDDGINFTKCTGEGATGSWRHPIITNTGRVLFCSVSGRGIIYSDDGINFTQCTGEGATDYWQYPIITNTGRILFGSISSMGGGIIYSDNGINFTKCTGEVGEGRWQYPIITNTGRILFGSISGDGIAYSDDGINFTQCTGEGATDYWQYPIITNTGRILFCSDNGNGIAYSDDGINFTKCTGEGAIGVWQYPIITNTGRVLFGSDIDSGIIYSDDGINFTQCTGQGATGDWWYPIITNTGRILFGSNSGGDIGFGNGIAYSDDGINFTQCTGYGETNRWQYPIITNTGRILFGNNSDSGIMYSDTITAGD